MDDALDIFETCMCYKNYFVIFGRYVIAGIQSAEEIEKEIARYEEG